MAGARLVLPFVIAAISGGCVGIREDEVVLSPSDINRAPDQYDGRKVTVKGFLTVRTSAHNFVDSRQARDDLANRLKRGEHVDLPAYAQQCLTVISDSNVPVSPRAADGIEAVGTGKYIANYLDGTVLDPGACPTRGALILSSLRETGDH